jgi:putative endonuclease
MKNIGQLGEKIIAQWLTNNGYEILYSRWRCRWGEIDLIAKDNKAEVLAFIEVKTRKINNWDNDGIFSVNENKQEKLMLTAETFLSENSSFSTFNCRFDIALLTYRKNLSVNLSINQEEHLVINDNNITYQGYQFFIVDYIENAFN